MLTLLLETPSLLSETMTNEWSEGTLKYRIWIYSANLALHFKVFVCLFVVATSIHIK